MSDYIWSPHGVNLTWTTSVPTTGLLFLPVTLLGGPVLSYNLLALLAPALSAWTAFLLALLMTTVTLVVLSLGPWLHFGGAWTGVPLPWLAVSHLPLIRLALPTRFTLYVSLCAAVATSLWQAKDTGRRWPRFALTALACVFLMPGVVTHARTAWAPWPRQAFFTARYITQSLGVRPNVRSCRSARRVTAWPGRSMLIFASPWRAGISTSCRNRRRIPVRSSRGFSMDMPGRISGAGCLPIVAGTRSISS